MEAVSWSRPTQDLALPEDELHIWLAWLDVEAQERTRLCSYLNKDEVSRAERFVFPRDRDHFIVARGRLRELLGKYLHCAPSAVQFKTGRYGKLSLLDDRDQLCFNLSHSYGLALYGFCIGRELGIDTEKIRPEFAGEGIAERYFSVMEQRELAELPKELRDTAFFRLLDTQGGLHKGSWRRITNCSRQLRCVVETGRTGNASKRGQQPMEHALFHASARICCGNYCRRGNSINTFLECGD